ncbi:MAG: hypothetical protein FJZ66_08155, partial [Bacteroidetes bacterium]|nr:hypothetical protein [Bacteroidota bacterium]
MKIKLIFLMIGIGCALHAQSFTKDKEKFCKEWNKFELDSKSSNFCKSELKNLLASPQISDTKFSRLVDVCNSLEKKGIPVNADVFNYMLAFIYQYVNKFDSEFTQEWAEIFVENLENKPDELSDFLLFSANLFRYKSLAKEAEYGWYYRKGNFEWVRNKKIQLICKDGELTCLVPVNETIGDSIKIVSTDGVFDLATKRWEGKGGVLSWEKVNGKNNETYANLNNYKVDFNKAILKADSVALSTPYFEKPILGKLIDKTILDLAESEKAPQFISFGHLKIPNLRENVDYVGSFVLEGGEFVGKGGDGRPAKMFFKVSDKIQVEIASQAFQMSTNSITSHEGSLKLHYKSGDSLSLQKGFFSYNLVRKELKITAGVVGGVALPFWDSHFNVYIKAPVLVWNGNNNTASFTFDVGTSQEQKYAIIESKDNYDGKLYAKYKPANSEHPFQLIAKKVVSTGFNEFGEGEIATAMNKIIDQIKPLIVDMMSDGFVQYNGTSKKIKVEQKLMDYVLAQNGQKDFDNLTIVSDFRPVKISISEADIQNNPELREERNNIMARNNKRQLATAFATIKIDDLELKITEVDKVVFSENQNVVAYCDSADLIMKKNRDMYFKGWVTAGKMDIFCKNAVFDYENFKVSILSSRDAYFNFYPIKSDDGNKPIASPSSISHFSGEILIDLPSSRSGKMSKIDAYPMLISRVNTKVYYNDKSILKSAYDSTRFYYEIWPFELDSLDNFNEKSLAF